jgi:hypothetical protein
MPRKYRMFNFLTAPIAPAAPPHNSDMRTSESRPDSFTSIMEELRIQKASRLAQESKTKTSSSGVNAGISHTIKKLQIATLVQKICDRLIDRLTTVHWTSERICKSKFLAAICKPGAVVWIPYLNVLAQKKPLPNHLKPEIAGHAVILLSVDFETGNVLFSAITSHEKYYNYLHHPISNFILCKNSNLHRKHGIVHLVKYSNLLPDQIAEETERSKFPM